MIIDCCGYETASETEMQHRNNDLLLYIAIGDAHAAAVEYVKPHEHQELIRNTLRLDGYYQHPTHLDLKPGMYTDDTQMSIAIAERLAELDFFGRGWITVAEAFVRTFHRDPRNGYARGFQMFLESVHSGDEFMMKIRPDSEKNGACMRAVPIGVLPDIEMVLSIAKTQAETTHNTPIGIYSAQMVALMSHYALYTDLPLDSPLLSYLMRSLGPQMKELNFALWADKDWHGPVKNPATNTVHAVYHLLTRCHTLSEVLRGAIQFGGDTDSVASIALGIASCRMENDLPQVLFDNLENGAYGRDYLKTLGKQLMDTYA